MSGSVGALSFREKLRSGDRLIGTFLKSNNPSAVEILGAVGFDFIVLDEEHAPLDRGAIDTLLLAAKAARMPALVRVAGLAHILPALDGGATGVLVPHVANASMAQDVGRLCRYRGGVRGFSTTTRAGDYGAVGRSDHVAASDHSIAVVAQIEDVEALDELDGIASDPNIDALFIGRGDLTVALDLDSSEGDRMQEIIRAIVWSARAVSKPVCVYAANMAEVAMLADFGATAFIVSSEQGLMREQAQRVLRDFRQVGQR